MPHRVALALQADGWIVRSDIVWAKPNPMPESVRDRPTKSHEFVFLLAKRERYFFDNEAVREKLGKWSTDALEAGDRWKRKSLNKDASRESGDVNIREGAIYGDGINPAGRNLRSVWSIPTESFPGAHFATYPRALVDRCVKAGTSEKGVCPTCGGPWVRVVERTATTSHQKSWADGEHVQISKGLSRPGKFLDGDCKTLGWRPSCECFGHFEEIDDEPDNPYVNPRRVYVPDGPQPDPIPATVFDPFLGSGTTGVVATGLNRRFLGVDLSPDYCRMAARRISRPHARHRATREEHHPLFAGLD